MEYTAQSGKSTDQHCASNHPLLFPTPLENKPYEEQLQELGVFSFKGHLLALYTCLKEGCSKVGISLFFQVKYDKRKHACREGRFSLDKKKKSFAERVIQHWNKFPREVADLTSGRCFKRHVGIMVRDMA